MKSFIAFTIVLFGLATHAGPSISGGVSEAPWARSQDIFGQVLRYMSTQGLPTVGIEIYGTNNELVAAKVQCNSGATGVFVFDIQDTCNQTPVMCIPVRNLKLDKEKSRPCK